MTDHADTIRRTFPDCKCEQHRAANEALDALVAERQQAIDERDAAENQLADETLGKGEIRAKRLQEALERIRRDWTLFGPEWPATIAADALVATDPPPPRFCPHCGCANCPTACPNYRAADPLPKDEV